MMVLIPQLRYYYQTGFILKSQTPIRQLYPIKVVGSLGSTVVQLTNCNNCSRTLVG